MGQFSWFTQDTKEAIREKYGCSDQFLTTAYMHDHIGNVWEEKLYEGYGVFGGKDYYVLLAEMNNLQVTEEEIEKRFSLGFDENKEESKNDLLRTKGINLAFEGNSSGENPDILHPNLTRYKNWKWENTIPKTDPNQGWGGDDEWDEEY